MAMPFGKPKARAPEAAASGGASPAGDETVLTDVLDLLRARGVLDLPWSDDAGVRAHYQDSYEVADSRLEQLRWLHPRNSQIPRSQSACRRQRTCARA